MRHTPERHTDAADRTVKDMRRLATRFEKKAYNFLSKASGQRHLFEIETTCYAAYAA